jgi:hypothetical protein
VVRDEELERAAAYVVLPPSVGVLEPEQQGPQPPVAVVEPCRFATRDRWGDPGVDLGERRVDPPVEAFLQESGGHVKERSACGGPSAGR